MANRTTIYLHGHQRERVVKTFGNSSDYYNELSVYYKLKSLSHMDKWKINLCDIRNTDDELCEITYKYGGSAVTYYNINKELKVEYENNLNKFEDVCVHLQLLPMEFNILMSEFNREFYFIDFEKFHFVDDTDRINNYFKEYREIQGIKI
mgnify:CR=1 FL=1|tara:strand:+ start:685 stop:1134 length:450 start_codon:yes stop_codon:yes gene_type:complete